jgi:phenylacetate-CoA ligase
MPDVEPSLPIEPMISGIDWPVIPPAPAAGILAMLFQLDRSQWWPAEAMRQHQFKQLQRVLDHAYRTVPFYRKRLDALGWDLGQPVSPEQWPELPTLSRQELQQAGSALESPAVPPDHGETFTNLSSGSTGRPVQTKGTAITQLLWRTLTLREHLWHHRDFSQKLAVIRRFSDLPPDGVVSVSWGPATHGVLRTGPCACLTIEHLVARQAAWLQQQAPAYLLTHPSNLLALANWFVQRQETLPGLLQARTFGEVLEPQARTACREAWGVPVADLYSSVETGYLALQCPEHDSYHVQAESVLMEVLDDAGRPCDPGQVGRVVVTTLHNFATPLLRYELGDYAQVGEPCPCGRRLPVLTRILGRKMNMLTLPSGDQLWPAFGDIVSRRGALANLPPIQQFQVIQRTVHDLDVKLVVPRPLRPEEEETVRNYFATKFGCPFAFSFAYFEEIPRSASGKFEEFRSEL